MVQCGMTKQVMLMGNKALHMHKRLNVERDETKSREEE